MTSAHKIAANRANARQSTGPNTARGRSRASRNALRHGLNVPISANPLASNEAEVLARQIAGTTADEAMLLSLACRIAEAHFDLARVQKARDDLISRLLAGRHLNDRAGEGGVKLDDLAPAVTETDVLQALDRYERRALSRRKFAIRELDAARRLAASCEAGEGYLESNLAKRTQ